jgi:uncharacterized integral membrane protein
MFRRSASKAPNGEDASPTGAADQHDQTESDERLAPDDRSSSVPDTVVPEQAASARPPAAGFDSRGHVRRTRAGAWWAGLVSAAILAIGLLIFIAQNSQDATIHYLGFSGQISLAVALLSSAAGGVLLVAIPGAIRMAQLRRALKKNAAAAED